MTTIQPYLDQGNYTQFHNANFDHIMPLLSGSEWKVLCFIIRKTKGWQKEEDDIAYSQFRDGTGISSNTTIKKSLAKLVEMGIIQQGKPDHKADPYGYRLNKNYSFRVTENDTPYTKKWTTGVPKSVNTKDTTKKKEEEKKKDPLKELVDIFVEKTNLRIPGNGKYKSDWLEPMIAIYKASGEHFDTTKQRVTVAIDILAEKGYSIYSPGSIQNTAVNLDIRPPTPEREIPQGGLQWVDGSLVFVPGQIDVIASGGING